MGNEPLTRDKLNILDTWNLKDIFESDEQWEIALKTLLEPVNVLVSYKNRAFESSETLFEVLELDKECSIKVMELYAYAKMNKDLDNSNSKYQEMYDKIIGEYFSLSEKTSFIGPKISQIDEELLKSWIINDGRLHDYRHNLDNIIRNKKYILSDKEESILSQVSSISEGIEEAFSMLNNLELDLGEIVLADGNKEKLTHGKFGVFREDKNRDVRMQAYEKMHNSYKRFGNTIAAIYTANVKSDVFFSRTRGYNSCIQRALFADNLNESIYTELINSIHEHAPIFYRYLELRKNHMGLSDLHLYDCSVPLVETPVKEYEFEEAKSILREGLSPLGQEYMTDVETLLSNRSIDVYETFGKTSGAYAWGTYNSHPYMLLNWSNRLNDVFTFAHETGHCMHSYYTNKSQTYTNSHYPIFLAEIASTVNENVLLKYLIDNCDVSTIEGKKEKAYLLNYFLEGVKNTVFRQTMFAEFELLVHSKIEDKQPVTAQILCEIYASLLKTYFGENVIIDEYMNWEWARIPHFYNSFYVYKYATGFCAASMIADRIFEEGQVAIDLYKKFLSSGGSDYPSNILNIMDIDMSKPDAVKATMKIFENNLNELEFLLKQIGEEEK